MMMKSVMHTHLPNGCCPKYPGQHNNGKAGYGPSKAFTRKLICSTTLVSACECVSEPKNVTYNPFPLHPKIYWGFLACIDVRVRLHLTYAEITWPNYKLVRGDTKYSFKGRYTMNNMTKG